MRTNAAVTALVILHAVFAPYAQAIQTNCPWNLRQLMGKSADELEPSTQLALQDILKAVYDNPPEHGQAINSKTSVADDLWLNDYQMWDAVKLMAKMGRERIIKEAADRKRRLLRRSFFGGIGVLGGAAILSLLADKGNFSLLHGYYGSESDPTAEDEIGLKIHKAVTSTTEIALLKEMSECDPLAGVASASERIGGIFSDSEKQYGMFPDTVLDRLVTGGSGSAAEASAVADTLLKLRAKFGIVVCTRWGHPSQGKMDHESLLHLYGVLDSLPGTFFSEKPFRLVLTGSDYWRATEEYPEKARFQAGKDGEVVAFDSSISSASDFSIVESFVSSRLSKWSPEKLRRWEQVLSHHGRWPFARYMDDGNRVWSLPDITDAKQPPLKVLSSLVTLNLSGEVLEEMAVAKKEAADILREAAAEVGLQTDPRISSWKSAEGREREAEKREQELQRERALERRERSRRGL